MVPVWVSPTGNVEKSLYVMHSCGMQSLRHLTSQPSRYFSLARGQNAIKFACCAQHSVYHAREMHSASGGEDKDALIKRLLEENAKLTDSLRDQNSQQKKVEVVPTVVSRENRPPTGYSCPRCGSEDHFLAHCPYLTANKGQADESKQQAEKGSSSSKRLDPLFLSDWDDATDRRSTPKERSVIMERILNKLRKSHKAYFSQERQDVIIDDDDKYEQRTLHALTPKYMKVMLDIFAKARRLAPIASAFQFMTKEALIKADEDVMSIIVKGHLSDGDLNGALQWLRLPIEAHNNIYCDFRPNRETFNSIIRSYAQRGLVEEVYNWRRKMTKEYNMDPDVHTETSAIMAHCAAKGNQVEKAEKIYKNVFADGNKRKAKAPRGIFTILIQAFSTIKSPEKCMHYFEIATKLGYTFDVMMLNNIVFAYATNPKFSADDTHKVLNGLLARMEGIEMNEKTFAQIIRAHAEDGDVQGANEWFEKYIELVYDIPDGQFNRTLLKKKNAKQENMCYTNLLLAYEKAGDAVGALQCWEDFQLKYRLKISHNLVISFIKVLNRMQQIKNQNGNTSTSIDLSAVIDELWLEHFDDETSPTVYASLLRSARTKDDVRKWTSHMFKASGARMSKELANVVRKKLGEEEFTQLVLNATRENTPDYDINRDIGL